MSAIENPHAGPGDLVVVGSSAGGIEALSVLVSTLPADFPAPLVLAQHLDPHRPSNLAAILERRTSLPIVTVSEHTPLEPGTIYVVPSNRHVTIKDGYLELDGDHRDRPRPSVDLLLSSAARAYGERLLAVILTGSGSDGAAGAVDVKNAGGTVIIQNPQTAHYPSMPMALPPTGVDHVADLEQIGPLLYDLVNGVILREPKEKTEDALRDILGQVSRQTNIDFRPYKSSTILRRLARRMAVTHNQILQDYGEYLEAHPEEVGELVMAFLIRVTEFFRDADAFTYLRDQILPNLIERGRANGRVLRFWSAGCATGEEPYSLAILLADRLGRELPEWSIKIFATDIDEGAISFARRGLYPRNVLDNLPDDYRERFFEPVDQGHRIVKKLRQMVIFGQQDLSHGAPFPRIDLLVCRNLLIYFKPELQQHVLDLFAYSLHQVNGYLFLGKAETARPSKATFELIDKRWKVYRCTNGPLPMPSRQGLPAAAMQLVERRGSRLSPQVEKQLADHEFGAAPLDIAPLRWFSEQVLRFVPIGMVVIDHSYRIMTINGVARRFLSIREPGYEQDFLHAVRGLPYVQIRQAIDTVFRERGTITLSEVALDPTAGGNGRYLTFTIALLQIETSGLDMALISVSDVTEQIQTRRRLEAVQAEQKQLVDELTVTNRRLSDMNHELQDANEELQAANEELMLAQEELQATNEEFEATNEELQATNEELETNNEELQATNEELETTNDELTARTAELQEMARIVENERARLAEMVELAPFDIIMLRGRNLIVETFNTRFGWLLAERDAQGHPFEEVLNPDREEEAALLDLVRAAYHEDVVRATPRLLTSLPDEGRAQAERYVVYTIVPTHDVAGKVDGVVLYAEDVTERRVREAEEEREKLQLIFDRAEQVALALYDAETMRLLVASERYLEGVERMHKLSRADAIGRTLSELALFVPRDQGAEVWQDVLQSRTPLRRSAVQIRYGQDQPETVWDWCLTPIMDTEKPDTVRYMLVSAIEITEQARAREEVERLNHLKDEFLALTSHELRTPMTTLIGYAQMLERLVAHKPEGSDRDQRIGRIAQRLDAQLKRLNQLIRDLLDVSRLQSGKLTLRKEPVNLAELLEQIVEDMRVVSDEHPIQLYLPESGPPLVVDGDPVRLTQVGSNLIQNAITHASDSKRIDVRLRRARGKGKGAPEMARIEVQDYGPGIAPEHRAALFTRFYQASQGDRTKGGGLGLGLFICKQIVERHGGTITVESAVGKGATFLIALPLTDASGQ